MYERAELQILKKRIDEPRRFIQVLYGPRQTGKTTLMTQLVRRINLPYIFESADAIAVVNEQWIEQLWERSKLQMLQNSYGEFLLIIDEIQKVNNWSEIIKRLWDRDTVENRNIKVIILGSSRVLLQKGLTESLAGRFETIYLGHWRYKEMHDAFGWGANQYAWFGGYPGSAPLIDDEERWKQYINNSLVETSISKDIIMLTRIDKPALMRNLFEIGCMYSGQILSFTKIQGQLHDAGNTTTLSHYLNLLDTAGLLGGLEIYTANIIRKRSSSPKFQVHNTALISSQRNETFNEIVQNRGEWGRIVESAVGAHLINYSFTDDIQLYYWRKNNQEVDFVIEKRGKIIGIEVKSSATGNISGMGAFAKEYNPYKVLLVGESRIPWQEFLQISPSELFD